MHAQPTKAAPHRAGLPGPFCYQAFGLTMVSDFPCPELLPGVGSAEVRLTLGPVPDGLASAEGAGDWFQRGKQEFLLTIEGVAKYLALAGERLIIAAEPGADPAEVRLFLLGSAMAALLQQRGFLLLHGCALAVIGQAILFIGPPGSGKSTLAGFLLRHGYELLADDVCVLSFPAVGAPVVHPGYPQLKLWADTLAFLGQETMGLMRLRVNMAKYRLPVPENFALTPAPLGQVYELTESFSRDLQVTSLLGLDKLTALINHSYRREFLTGNAAQQRHFQQCGQIGQSVPVSHLEIPRNLRELPKYVAELSNYWL